jgi:hypothetical protein
MFGNHSIRVGLASVTLTCFASILLQGCQKQAEQPSPAQAPPPKAAPVTPPAPPPVPTGAVSNNIPSTQAQQHIGETNTICGPIASTRYLESPRGGPTFLNFDRPYPNHTMTVLIQPANRSKFPTPPELMYSQKVVCVAGPIITYHGKPEIVVQDPSQIVIMGDAPPPPASATATNVNPQAAPAAGGTTSDTNPKPQTVPSTP